MSKECRVVYAVYGSEAAMGYKFRVRIESKIGFDWWGFTTPIIKYRAIIERYHMAWCGYNRSCWLPSKEGAVDWGNGWLDDISSKPPGEYI